MVSILNPKLENRPEHSFSYKHWNSHFVSDVMHTYASKGFEQWEPTAKKINQTPKIPLGIHHRWASNSHDKLYKIGFPIWAVVDDATGWYLGGWVVPSNRMTGIVTYCFLILVVKFEGECKLVWENWYTNAESTGIPIQFTMDHGSETTGLFGLINALQYRYSVSRVLWWSNAMTLNSHIFYPECPVDEVPAHIFLRSIQNIAIKWSWLWLCLDFGDNAIAFFQKGIEDGIYNSNNENQ